MGAALGENTNAAAVGQGCVHRREHSRLIHIACTKYQTNGRRKFSFRMYIQTVAKKRLLDWFKSSELSNDIANKEQKLGEQKKLKVYSS